MNDSMDQWAKLMSKCKPELPTPVLAFFVGYACGAARSSENIAQIIEAFQAATKQQD